MGWGSANIHSLNYPYLEDLRRERRLVDGQCAGAEQLLQRRRGVGAQLSHGGVRLGVRGGGAQRRQHARGGGGSHLRVLQRERETQMSETHRERDERTQTEREREGER